MAVSLIILLLLETLILIKKLSSMIAYRTTCACLLVSLNANVKSSSTPKSYFFRKYNSIDLTALKKELSSTQLITSLCLTSCADLYDQYASTLTASG